MLKNYKPPTDGERRIAISAAANLTLPQEDAESVQHFIYDSLNEESIELPAGAVAILSDVLSCMSRGQGITLFPRLAELTTVEAADILNVSRPYVIKLLDEGEIPYRLVGKHRRIPLANVIEFKNRIDREREAVLDEMVAEAQELGLYD